MKLRQNFEMKLKMKLRQDKEFNQLNMKKIL